MGKINLPSISDVNGAKGAEVREMYERVFDEPTTSKDTNALKAKIIAELKRLAKETKKAPQDDKFATTEKAAFDAEKKGEWLTAALAWESAAKMLPDGPGKQLALDRAATARVNAAKPDSAPADTSGDDEATKAAKKAEKDAADAKAKADKEAAKAAKDAEKKAKAEAEAQEKAKAKAEKEEKAKAAAAEKEAAALAAKAEKEEKAKAAAAEKEEKAKALAAEREAKKAARIAEREAKKAAKGDGKKGDEPFAHDERIAHLVGQTIKHTTKNGVTYEIKVLPDGFEYKGEHYKSLSAVGRFVNGGKSTNGFVFFGLSTLPRPELKDTASVIANFNAARYDGLTDDLETILDGSVPEAHAHHTAILAAADRLEAKVKALRLGAKLIEAKKGRPVAAK